MAIFAYVIIARRVIKAASMRSPAVWRCVVPARRISGVVNTKKGGTPAIYLLKRKCSFPCLFQQAWHTRGLEVACGKSRSDPSIQLNGSHRHPTKHQARQHQHANDRFTDGPEDRGRSNGLLER